MGLLDAFRGLFRRSEEPRAPLVDELPPAPAQLRTTTAPVPPPPPGPYAALYTAMESFEREVERGVTAGLGTSLRLDLLRTELGTASAARRKRLTEAAESCDAARLLDWQRADLEPYLDAVSGHLSDVAEAVFLGNADLAPFRDRLQSFLFAEVSAGCGRAALFTLQPVVPYESDFDPGIHDAAGGKERSGARGKVVRLVSPGRLDVAGRLLTRPARVLVGK